MSFDAQAWIKAHEPPTYIDRAGVTHTGRLWSHLEYIRWVKVFEKWLTQPETGDALTDDQYETELRRMFSSLGFADEIVEEMINLPSVALEQMAEGFFVCQLAGRQPPSTPEPPLPSNPTT
jgi:hypothetical protein